MMDIEEIRKRYSEGFYKYKSNTSIPKKVSDSHIFDENLTIKENRQMILDHNNRVRELHEEAARIQAKLDKQLHEDVINYIVETYAISLAQAQILESYVYYQYHSCMYDYFGYIDSIGEVVYDILHADENMEKYK